MEDEEELLEVIPLGKLPAMEEVTVRIFEDTLEGVWDAYYEREDKLESFDSVLSNLLEEAIENRKIKNNEVASLIISTEMMQSIQDAYIERQDKTESFESFIEKLLTAAIKDLN